MFAKVASNPHARLAIWSGAMLNGVGSWVLMYMIASALWEQSISLIEIEILFLSHALWYGVGIATSPPDSVLPVVLLTNPHTYLFTGVLATAYDMPRPICYANCVLVLVFGFYRRYVQMRPTIFDKEGSMTLQDWLDAFEPMDTPEAKGTADVMRKTRGWFPWCADAPPDDPEHPDRPLI
jgi:hypothetical protein